MNRARRMQALLNARFSPGFLQLDDDSSRHIGHAGNPDGAGETHYTLTIESPLFSGLSKVKRHQAIYAALAEEFQKGLHALSIQAFAPGEKRS